jgi:hypothetical protein
MRVGTGTSKVMEAEGQLEAAWARGGGAVADADDLELLGEAGAHTDDHVVDQRSGQTVQRAELSLVVGPLDEQRSVLLPEGDARRDVAHQRALRALDRHALTSDADIDTAGHGDGGSSDPRHVSNSLSGLPDEAQDLAAHLALTRLAVGHEP